MTIPIKKNIYKHSIELAPLSIPNKPREEMMVLCRNLEYRGYEVEEISDGRKIAITKPGGKIDFISGEKEDFLVWVHDPKAETLWLISHKDIYEDLRQKGEKDPAACVAIINALERVYSGEDPVDVIKDIPLVNPCGELPEVLLKAYKWIWAQEDCNYPEKLGRRMSFEGITVSSGKIKKAELIKILRPLYPEITKTLKEKFPREQTLNVKAVISILKSDDTEASRSEVLLKTYMPGQQRQTGMGLIDLRKKFSHNS